MGFRVCIAVVYIVRHLLCYLLLNVIWQTRIEQHLIVDLTNNQIYGVFLKQYIEIIFIIFEFQSIVLHFQNKSNTICSFQIAF